MDDVITNRMLLEHMQGMKNELKEQTRGIEGRLTRLESKVDRGFEEAKIHRQALQEDLEATMRQQGKHERKLTSLTRRHS